jgi:hypothetical protein
MYFDDDTIHIDKPPSQLDSLIIEVAEVLSEAEIDYAIVSGYAAVLLGRSRATEDIDVIVEPFSSMTAGSLATKLRQAGFGGASMPLDQLHETLSDDLIFRVAEDGHRAPNVELKFPSDTYDRTSLQKTVTVDLNDAQLRVGCLELQIAYKLRLGAQHDFEDALYLYHLVEPMLNMSELEQYARELDVENEYDQLKDA